MLIAYMYVAALTQLFWLNFASISTYLEDLLRIPPSDIMWLTIVFPAIQVLLTLPAGIFIDRKGFKYGTGVGAVLTGVFAMLRLLGPESFTILLISQIGIAIGQPFVLNGVTKLATTWFGAKEEGLAVGLGSFALFIGMLVALGLTPQLVQAAGFSGMLQIYGVLGLLGTPAFLILVKSSPPTSPRIVEDGQSATGWSSIRQILKVRDMVILGFIALIGIGVFNGLATWLETILNELQGMSLSNAGTVSAVLIVSAMAGCIVMPMLSDRIGRRKPFLIAATLIGGLSVFLLIFSKSYTLNMINAIAIGFFFISALPIMLTMSAEITGPKFAGVSVGYLQLLGNLAAVVLIAIMENLRSSSGSFVSPILMLVVLMAAAFIISYFIHDTHP
ncbi:MAG TPA: MFS transporter [Dehalococcoidia bacterium]|nr:MFS transporter [Dehalococcoidia bacterium]